MKKETLVNIKFALVLSMVVIVVFAFCWILIISPAIDSSNEANRIESLFMDYNFNIPDDFTIIWTEHIGANYHIFKNSDWYYWNVEIYRTNQPYLNGEIELWLNIETLETCYVGELP